MRPRQSAESKYLTSFWISFFFGFRSPKFRAKAHIARHVIDTHVEPSCLELNGILWRGD